MADSKITALTAITTVNPATYPLVIVDTSDTSMAITGTTKKVTTNQLLGSGGTATLASATITGDLTVDTSTLKVDSANNRVGIGTASPISLAQFSGSTPTIALSDTNPSSGSFFNLLFRHTDGLSATYNIATIQGQTNGNGGNGNLIFFTASSNSNTERYKIDSTGVATWSNVGGVAGTAMTLNSTGLGVGDAPAANTRLTLGSVNPTGLNLAFKTTGVTTGRVHTYLGNTSGDLLSGIEGSTAGQTLTGSAAYSGFIGTFTNNPFYLVSNGLIRATIDSSGNVGVGVTPSAGGGCLQLKSGITFPATQVASSDANTLDDYEEGTWTPSVGGTATYTTQTGRYVKIGNRVFVTLRMTINTIGTGDDYRISGLPFQPATVLAAASVGFFANLKISANFISGYASTASSVITMTGTTAASANITNGIGVFGNGSDIVMSCFYEI